MVGRRRRCIRRWHRRLLRWLAFGLPGSAVRGNWFVVLSCWRGEGPRSRRPAWREIDSPFVAAALPAFSNHHNG